jgi:hypothetical protein
MKFDEYFTAIRKMAGYGEDYNFIFASSILHVSPIFINNFKAFQMFSYIANVIFQETMFMNK